MRKRSGVWVFVAVLLLTLGQIAQVQAATVFGRASTEIEWYDNADEETLVPMYQYLLLNVNELGSQEWSFRGYGRIAEDLFGEEEVDSRLYYAYLEKKALWDKLNVRLGRQFVSTTAGASIMDGVTLNYHAPGSLEMTLFGGGDVAYYEGYNAEDLIGGVEISGTCFDDVNLGLSYLQKWDDGALANELFGFDADYDWRETLHLYSETQFDYLSNTVSYALAGARYHKAQDWSVRAEYLYSLPVFSSTSIYSVFAVDEYQELFFETEKRLAYGLRGFINYTRELYETGADADVVEAGIEKVRNKRFSGYFSTTWRNDPDGQDLTGFKIYSAAQVTPKLQLGVGVNVDVLERYLDDDEDETTSSRAWVDSTYRFNRKFDLQAKLERVESDLWDEYLRGRVRLNVRF